MPKKSSQSRGHESQQKRLATIRQRYGANAFEGFARKRSTPTAVRPFEDPEIAKRANQISQEKRRKRRTPIGVKEPQPYYDPKLGRMVPPS